MFTKGRTISDKSDEHSGKWPLVSVIIPTKNSEATIERCLESIVEQTYPKVEVVIVDGTSNDNTIQIARNFEAKVEISNSKRSEARNIGAHYSDGELVLFVDSDMRLNTEVIMDCVERIKEGCDALIIPEISTGVGFWAKCKALEKSCYIGDDTVEAVRFFKRDIFNAVGGYDVSMEAGEDWDITERIRGNGHVVGRTKSIVTHEEGRLSLTESMRKKHKYGKTLGVYVKHQRRKARKQLNLLRFSYFRSWRMLAADPIHAFGMFVMKTCEFGAGFVGFLQHEG